MKSSLLFTSLAVTLLAASCDEPKALLRERALVEAEILRGNEEMKIADAKFEAAQKLPFSYGMTLERYNEENVKKNTALEVVIAHQGKKCAAAEAALKVLRPRLADYKAKYLNQ